MIFIISSHVFDWKLIQYDFYLYFIIGCACYINIKKNPKKFYYGEKEFLIDNEKKPLLNEDIIEP